MPSLYYRVEAPGVNILDTVTSQVVTGFLDEVDLHRYFKDAVYIQQSFSAYSQYDDGNGTPTLNKNRCDVEVNHIMDKSQVPWPVDTPYTTPAYGLRSTKKGNHSPILIDEKANILIEHYTVACAIEMDFTLNFQTFDDACKAFDTIQTKYKGSLIQTPFDISFSYPVSMGMLKYLSNVYEAKTDYQNKTLWDYIDDHKATEISFDIRKSQLDKEDADKELMIRCQQLNCLAQVTFDQKEPDGVRVGQLPDYFTIQFQMVFQFGRPNLVVVNTPVSVDNTVLDYGLFENLIINYHFNPEVTGLYQDLTINEFMSRSYGNYQDRSQIIRIPSYDDWFTADRLYAEFEYRPFLIGHFTLDGPLSQIDLKQMDDVVLHPIAQAILKETGNKVFNYGGLFHIGVYANELRLSQELVSIDENLIMTIHSNRPDKIYHFVISETTNLKKTDPQWDPLLIKYRYFFPMTIEKNINELVEKKYFYIAYDDSFLSLISKLSMQNRLKPLLRDMVTLEECTNEIYSYTQNSSQLADYLVYTPSMRKNYILPKQNPDDPESPPVQVISDYYSTLASPESRSLFVAFIEQCLLKDYISLDMIPTQYLTPNQTIFPYTNTSGGYYGFNTPVRVFKYNIRPERHP